MTMLWWTPPKRPRSRILMRPRATQQIPMRASIAHASGMVSRFATVYFARAMGLFVMVKIDCKSG